MTLIDTHCHLDHPPLDVDTGAVLARAAARGVARVVVPSYDAASWDAVAALGARPDVFPAFGLHPWVADQVPAVELAVRLAPRLGGAVAVGEIGLDDKLGGEGPDLATQLAVLRPQLELAVDHDLPVILHARGGFDELLAELDRLGGRLRGVVHAFSRGPELAERFLAAGMVLGLGGAVTRPRARRVRRAARRLPLESFVLETDAPSIGLEGVPPARTEPAHVADVAAALAAVRGIDVAAVAAATTARAEALFGLASGGS